jgi:NAD(P)-dependent dehydrogenase (short-subunit alcohol dehydrogenase family)
VIEVNVKGIYRCTRAVVPIMIQNRRGAIVNTSSTFGLVGFADRAVYVASKGAVTQLTKAMALDYGPFDIRVNCICPGMTLNRRVRAVVKKAEEEGKLAQILAPYALGRLGSTEEVARVAAFLASDDASWVTGAALAVDGGYTAR